MLDLQLKSSPPSGPGRMRLLQGNPGQTASDPAFPNTVMLLLETESCGCLCCLWTGSSVVSGSESSAPSQKSGRCLSPSWPRTTQWGALQFWKEAAEPNSDDPPYPRPKGNKRQPSSVLSTFWTCLMPPASISDSYYQSLFSGPPTSSPSSTLHEKAVFKTELDHGHLCWKPCKIFPLPLR